MLIDNVGVGEVASALGGIRGGRLEQDGRNRETGRDRNGSGQAQ